ncbi:hypothetical protein [Pontibacter akesuensis]|uniref:Uncharacterized protein n=1 Tax=Pontibacter akesuensis TaxID=388950 RepID=A0A1I7GK06_9BACT|nr:hypothetical protein [Pontibacter akesuensis]GHA56451.1 hypothetical protein GCM10007389_05060 [Pontibacter akesuensis]SFU48586.1 hypothetical protein SAMN04487941_1066 [Pontibacter akesuensis]
MKTSIILLALSLCIFAGCQSVEQQENSAQSTTATLHWTGEIAADGCGFEVEIDGKRYLPENEDAIPAKFKERESAQVQLEYEPLAEPIDRRCGMLPQPRVMDAIRVIAVNEV